MKFAVIDVDDVILDWTSKFRQACGISPDDYSKPFYGMGKAEFDSSVEWFNGSVHFGCLDATSLIHMCENRSFHIHFLSSCGNDDNTVFFRENNLKKWLSWDDERYTLTCLPLHASKREFFERFKEDILFVIDDAWKNCEDSASLGIHTIQMISPSRTLETWEKEWYHVGDSHPSVISMI